MKDFMEQLGEKLKYLNPEMDFPFKKWSIVITRPDRIPDLEERRDYLERLIVGLENTWHAVKDDIKEDVVNPDELCLSLDYVEETLKYFYSERESLLCEGLR